MSDESSKPVTSTQSIDFINTLPSDLINNVKTEQVEILIQNIQRVINDMKKEVNSNPLIPEKIFRPLFATLDSLQHTLDPRRPNVFYVVGGSNAGKSTMINALCGEEICKVSHSHIRGTTDFQVVSVSKTNAVFVDTEGFGSSIKGGSDLVKKIETQMKNVDYPDAIILVVTKDHLRREGDLRGAINYINSVSNWLKKQRYNTEVPVLCVLNKIDEYFDNRLPDAETEIEDVKKYTKDAWTIVNKYLVSPAILCIAISKTKNYGIDELRRNINAQSPLNAQIIDKNLDYVSQYRVSIANKVIAAFSAASAAVSFVPIIDIALVTLLQEWMYRMLACFSIDPTRTPDSFKAVHCVQQVASLGIRTGALFIGGLFQLSVVGYLVGSSICVAAAATSTAALGWASYSYFTREISL